jgi:hypothetical protein
MRGTLAPKVIRWTLAAAVFKLEVAGRRYFYFLFPAKFKVD